MPDRIRICKKNDEKKRIEVDKMTILALCDFISKKSSIQDATLSKQHHMALCELVSMAFAEEYKSLTINWKVSIRESSRALLGEYSYGDMNYSFIDAARGYIKPEIRAILRMILSDNPRSGITILDDFRIL